MNTCLSVLYSKINQFDPRYVRLAVMAITLVAAVGTILGVPMPGDVGL